jgi:sugar phosphate isomerase/epimerase
MWNELGVDRVGLITPKIESVGWDKVPALVDGLRVSNIAAERRVLHETIDLAATLRTDVVYILSGAIGARTWEEATSDFVDEMAPYVAHARALGVELGVESTNPLRSDLSFLFTYHDVVDTAGRAGMTAVLDLYSCWWERGLGEAVRGDLGMPSLVQVCDYKLGTYQVGTRAVIGEGDIPLERLLSMLLNAGYEGPFDLEILGEAIRQEGYTPTIGRSVERLEAMLDRIGA